MDRHPHPALRLRGRAHRSPADGHRLHGDGARRYEVRRGWRAGGRAVVAVHHAAAGRAVVRAGRRPTVTGAAVHRHVRPAHRPCRCAVNDSRACGRRRRCRAPGDCCRDRGRRSGANGERGRSGWPLAGVPSGGAAAHRHCVAHRDRARDAVGRGSADDGRCHLLLGSHVRAAEDRAGELRLQRTVRAGQ